jgi:hypothetical protein
MGDTKVKKERLGGRFGRTQRSNSKNASKEDKV